MSARRIGTGLVVLAATVVLILVIAEPFASKKAGGQAPTVNGYVYVSSEGADRVYPFSFDFDGNPTKIDCGGMGSYCNSGSHPNGVAITPDGRFLYVAALTDNVITPFSITGDGSPAALTCPSPSDCSSASTPTGLAVSPDGRFLYSTNRDRSPDGVRVYSIHSDGTLGQVDCGSGCDSGTEPYGVAISADGRFVYAANSASDTISAFLRNPNGSLSQITCPGCATGTNPRGLTVTPDGRFLYAANRGSSTISAFSIGSNGALTKVDCPGTGCQAPTASDPEGIAASPDGRFVYVTDTHPVVKQVSGFKINPDGSLSQIPCDPATNCTTTGDSPEGIAVSPDSKFVFVSNAKGIPGGLLSAFKINSDGSLTTIACSSPNCDIGYSDNFQSLAVAPIQAPTASFHAGPLSPGQASDFDGSASRGTNRALARWDWDFGDGSRALDAGPQVTHVYGAPGTYTVTLTVADDTGCSTKIVFTGQTVSCNGGPSARQSQTITIPGGGTAGAVSFSIGKSQLNKKKGTAQLPVTVPQPGTVKLTGKDLAAQSVSASGTVNVLVKATGKTKKKLSSKGKASVRATITYEPASGAPSTQTVSITLRKRK